MFFAEDVIESRKRLKLTLNEFSCSVQKKHPQDGGISEATTGFEPVIRVLQTLAFPLGHVANITLS